VSTRTCTSANQRVLGHYANFGRIGVDDLEFCCFPADANRERVTFVDGSIRYDKRSNSRENKHALTPTFVEKRLEEVLDQISRESVYGVRERKDVYTFGMINLSTQAHAHAVTRVDK